MSLDPQRRLHAAHAVLTEGWARDVLLAWDGAGTLTTVSPETPAPTDAPRAAGVLLPGLPNLHSHAFQRAFAGLAEYRGDRIEVITQASTDTSAADSADSFWTWRDLMYRFALAISPDQLEAVATQLYIELLQAGYTAVCEFHYLHHDPRGRPYAEPAEMALRLLAAARDAGIGITLLPVLYQHAGFGATPPRGQQRRFVTDTDALLDIAARLRAHGANVGIAPHSLRAVGARALREVVAGLHAVDASAPVHIHIAEQQREVDDCLAWCGQRPVEWLLANAAVDARWCIVHATHLSDAEPLALAASGAVAGLCPSTEENLGDGVFDAAAYLAAGSAWGIGSDSHASVDAAGELRWLEYTQRLARQRRNVLTSRVHRQVADHLWLGAVGGGARASGRSLSGLAVGHQADFIVLDGSGTLAGLAPPQALASHVFARAGRGAVRDVWVAGVQRVHEGRHALERSACARFVAAPRKLLDEV